MRIFDRKSVSYFAAGIMFILMPTTGFAFDKNRTISQDELSNGYGTINKKYDKKSSPKPPRRRLPPLEQSFEKGSFAYSMGVDAAQSDDLVSAIKHWKLSSADGNFYANWQLARYYLGTFDGQKNDKDAINYLQLVVAQYDLSSESRVRRQISADAMVELANFFTSGSEAADFKPRIAIALKLLKLASSSVGHAKANFLLGELYFTDEYIMPQKKRAVRYYTLAARKNHFAAQIKLGQIYYLQGRDFRTKIQGLAWLLVAGKNKLPELQEFANDIIAQSSGEQLNEKQTQAANNIAERIYLKWNF
ncbi:MAG: sel1 repeat family protein [Alphaproteobacteria bacterium]|nr:sel1 repeat family protein [Alphaproteobacteria bacterium]